MAAEGLLVLPRFDAHPDGLTVLPAGGVWWEAATKRAFRRSLAIRAGLIDTA